jgi:phosphoribosylformylglycinamidine synthase
MTLPTHCLIVYYKLSHPRAPGLLADAHALGVTALTYIEVADLYFVEGELSPADRARLVTELLSDPITQTAQWRSVADGVVAFRGQVVETALRSGVTDAVAEQIVHGAQLLGITRVRRAATGQRFVLHGNLSEADLHTLAKRLLVNPVIQRYAFGEIEPTFPQAATATPHVAVIALRELDDDELLALSRERRAALNLAEMQALQAYYRALGRDATDVEFETIAQTWSEHCVHKTFKAKVSVQYSVNSGQYPGASSQSGSPTLTPNSNSNSRQVVDGILKTYIRAATEQINAPWVRSAFVDNAGIIDFDEEFEISFKVETHNHPSAIEPFGGANTGVGGVIRDILGVSAKPIAATDVLCFGPQDLDPNQLPEGVLHPRRIRAGVIAGIQDYGNKIGVPTVSGAIVYDEGFTSNPLVFCGCVGIAPKGSHPREPHAGERVIVIGGRTGRDGLRGATFSSQTMDAQTGEVAGASVQIGDPITEKGLIEVITRARDAKLYHAITDCGAGGFSSAVGEMAKHGGAEVDLSCVRLKYAGLAPWEIWLSEAQERMVLAVPSEHIAALQKLCDTFNVELTDIGAFNDTGRLVVRYGERVVLELANDFLHNGLPQRTLTATVQDVAPAMKSEGERRGDFGKVLLELLAHPNIASKADVIRIYDHEVQGGTVVKPLVGAMNDGPSDAVVIKPLGTKGTRGIVLSCGIKVEYGKHDPYRMAISAVDEAIRNAVAVGADPERIALLDNFCWGDPNRPETLGALVEAARGCYDAALHYRTPFISGKDSLNNEYLGSDGKRHAIPPTLLISAIGIIEDVNKAVTMDLKEVGNMIYLINPQSPIPNPNVYCALHRAVEEGLVQACHDVNEGGIAAAAAEMCIGGRLGMTLTIEDAAVFAEADGQLLVEVYAGDRVAFEEMVKDVRRIGMVTGDGCLTVNGNVVRLEELVTAWQGNG